MYLTLTDSEATKLYHLLQFVPINNICPEFDSIFHKLDLTIHFHAPEHNLIKEELKARLPEIERVK